MSDTKSNLEGIRQHEEFMGKPEGKRTAEVAKVVERATVWTITPAEVRKGKAIDLDFATSSIRERQAEVTRAGNGVMFDAALLTHAVVAAENIGKGKPFATQGDYAKAIQFAPSYVSRLKYIGRAVVVHGVTKASGDFAFLCQHGSNAKVAAAVALTDTAEFRRLLKQYRAEIAEHGRITGDARTPQIASEKGETVEGEVVSVTDTPVVGDPMDAVKAALKALDAACKAAGFTRETWAPIEDKVTAIVKREVTLLDKAEKASAKAEKVPA